MTTDPYWQQPEEQRIKLVSRQSRQPTLFSLTDEMLDLLAVLEGDVDEGAVQAQIEAVSQALAQKVDGYVSVIRHMEMLRDARAAEARRLKDKSDTASRLVDELKARLKTHMEVTGQKRIETTRHTVSLVANPQPTVTVLEEMMVPGKFKKTVITTTVDKRAIAKHVEETGEVVEGVEVVRSNHVRLS